MQENLRIQKLFEALYNGSPWIDVNIVDTLKSLDASQAIIKVFTNGNSIWQIVNHILQWRKNILKRLYGEIIATPDDNYYAKITGTTEPAWKKLLKEFEQSQMQWMEFLKNAGLKNLEVIDAIPFSHYEYILGILQHDAYHLGQVAMLVKQIKK